MDCAGIIGLGKMGMPIALNLMQRGFRVVGYRRSGSPELEAAGGISAGSPAEVAAQADVLLSILPGADDVEQVVCGPYGTRETLRPGVVHIEMSTVEVDDKRRVRDAVVAVGGDMLDCPVSGGPSTVAGRRCTVFASGERASVEAVQPVLDAVSDACVFVGEFGAGTSMKYVANMLVAIHTAAAAEALLLARRSGLDLALVQRTLDTSLAASGMWMQRGPIMAERRWLPAPGPITTLHDILIQTENALVSSRANSPLFAVTKALFDEALQQGWGHLDIAAVHDLIDGRDPLSGADDGQGRLELGRPPDGVQRQ